MATFYNRVVRNVDTDKIVAFQSSSASTIILSMLCANTDGANNADITIQQDDASNNVEAYVAFTLPIPADANVDAISNKMILPSGKKIAVSASSSGKLDVIVSYVEV